MLAKLHDGRRPMIDPQHSPLTADMKTVAYIAVSSTLGVLSALAALLGNEEKALSFRTITAYLVAGGLVSCGVVFLLVQYYGFSYFLLGVSIFAGYKAFDSLSLIGLAVSNLVKRFLNAHHPPKKEDGEGDKKEG